MDAEVGTEAGDELEVFSILIAAYEETHFPIDHPEPLDAILYIMEQKGYLQKDFAALIGKSRASEILNKKRELSMPQAKLLHKEWGIPAEALLSA
jgi:HTH-type transcriptional regulator/antitoxin HigA